VFMKMEEGQFAKWEAEAAGKRKDMKALLKKMHKNHTFAIENLVIASGPGYCEEFEGWRAKGVAEVMGFMVYNPHQTNGKWGGWNNGSMGSRWCDVRLKGYDVRLVFYSRKYDAEFFTKLGVHAKAEVVILITDYFQGKDEDGPHESWKL